MNPTPQFTSATIARALGKKRQAIQRLLNGIAPSGLEIVNGNEANAWQFCALPSRLQIELNNEAQRRGCADAVALLTMPPQIWQPPIPVQQVRPEFVSRALKLRDALALPLARQHTLSPGQLTELGSQEFARVFGYTISAKQLNRLFDRTVLRDNGAEQFHRVEIYLDEAAFQKPIAKIAVVARQFDHAPLVDVLAQLESKEAPTPDDRAFLFHTAFAHLESLAIAHPAKREQHAAKASVIAFLHSSVPALAKSLAGLRRTFDRNLAEWRAGERTVLALRDQRELTSGNFRAPLCAGCKQTLISLAVAHDGNESLAYRLARTKGLLCAPCTEGQSFNPRVNKSAVPPVVREQITPLVESVLPLHRGPHEAKMRGPYIIRRWDDVQPGDWFSADDITFNHYFRAEDGTITRGECLLMIDLRTGYPLEFRIIAGKYNSEHIRGLVLRTHDIAGLPHHGFYFERSVWASRLIDGERREGMPAHWRETENGLKERGLNLDVRHATTPRAKTIEGIIRILQERMRSIPGFVGFNERTDRRERVQAVLSRARRGDDASLAALPTMEEWRNTVRGVLNDYAHDPQNGKMLDGATPAEMWNEAISKRPLIRLPDEARYILATHKTHTRVRQEGIVLTVRGKKFIYFNEHTGALIGRDVLAHYNVEAPELLTVSDMKRQNFFTVKRVELPAMSATGEQFAEAHAAMRGHQAAAKALYGEIKHDLVTTITRDADHDDATKQLGKFHNAEVQTAVRDDGFGLARFLDRACGSADHSDGVWYCPDVFEQLLGFIDLRAEQTKMHIAPTVVAEKVFDALDYANTERVMVRISGDPRFGKTESVETWAAMWPGRARVVRTPSSNSEKDLLKAIAEAFGIQHSHGVNSQNLKDKVEFVIRFSGLALIFDEAAFLVPSQFSATTPPARLNWVRCAIVDRKIPCVLVVTPQSYASAVNRFVKKTSYSIEQFLGREALRVDLPNELSHEDLLAVARIHFPGEDEDLLSLVVSKAMQSESYLKAVEHIAKRARYNSKKRGAKKLSVRDVDTAIAEVMPQAAPVPSDNTPAAPRAARKQRSRSNAATVLQTQFRDAAVTQFPARNTTPLHDSPESDPVLATG